MSCAVAKTRVCMMGARACRDAHAGVAEGWRVKGVRRHGPHRGRGGGAGPAAQGVGDRVLVHV